MCIYIYIYTRICRARERERTTKSQRISTVLPFGLIQVLFFNGGSRGRGFWMAASGPDSLELLLKPAMATHRNSDSVGPTAHVWHRFLASLLDIVC